MNSTKATVPFSARISKKPASTSITRPPGSSGDFGTIAFIDTFSRNRQTPRSGVGLKPGPSGPGYRHTFLSRPEGTQQQALQHPCVQRPFRAQPHVTRIPGAEAPGYIPSPLRGEDADHACWCSNRLCWSVPASPHDRGNLLALAGTTVAIPPPPAWRRRSCRAPPGWPRCAVPRSGCCSPHNRSRRPASRGCRRRPAPPPRRSCR